MLNRNVLIVEDESIIAESLKRRLSKFGYEVVGIAMTGEEAIEMAAEKHPDLILMDIQLRGKMDGVEAANHIYSTFKIPVIFITAHTDSTTIERAKVTEPFGYLPKPIKATELQTTIEVALFKSQQEQKRRNHTQLLEIALSSLRHAVIALDKHAKILFLNSFAEETLSITQSTFIDHHLSELFLINNLSCLEEPLENILEKFQPLTDKQYHLKLTTKNASSLSFSAQVFPLTDKQNSILGAIVNLNPLNKTIDYILQRSRTPEQIVSVCAFCKQVRNEVDEWEQMETFLTNKFEIFFSHGICPECITKWYPDIGKI